MTAPLDPDRWQLVRHWFDLALAVPAEQREAWLASRTDCDPSVRQEVAALLAHAGDDRVPEQVLGVWPTGPAGDEAPAEALGRRCGAWQLERLLGRGGMADVYLALRADGAFEGQAAVKLLRSAAVTPELLRRFEREQHLLGRLEHPNIGRLFDAGLTEDGTPFLVMECIDGEPIDVAARGRPLRERLALFVQLADAVAYAHRRLLLHRDLKPSNVLVDRRRQVKLLDFGIAKLIDGEADGVAAGSGATHPGLTQQHVRVYTPSHASPEQIRGEAVGTATDIYSLGVLLYQMLTGVRPCGARATTPVEAAQAALEEMPLAASRSSADAASPEGAAAWRSSLRGDLDNILAKALQKRPDDRYASAEAFASDVRAFLDGRPVAARAPTWAYVTGKWLARHRWPVAAAAAALIAVLAGTVAALWQAHEATLARDEARARLADARKLAKSMVVDVANDLQTSVTAGRRRLMLVAADYLAHQTQAGLPDEGEREELADVLGWLAELESNPAAAGEARFAEAQNHDVQALALWAQRPSVRRDTAWWGAVGDRHRHLAWVQMQRSMPVEAARSIEAALGHHREAARGEPDGGRYHRAVCADHTRWADIAYSVEAHASLQDPQRAWAELAAAHDCALQLPTSGTEDGERRRRLLSAAVIRTSALALREGRFTQAQRASRENRELLESAPRAATNGQPAARTVEAGRFLILAAAQDGYARILAGSVAEGLAELHQAVQDLSAVVRRDAADQTAFNDLLRVKSTLCWQRLRHASAAAAAECSGAYALLRQQQRAVGNGAVAGELAAENRRLIEPLWALGQIERGAREPAAARLTDYLAWEAAQDAASAAAPASSPAWTVERRVGHALASVGLAEVALASAGAQAAADAAQLAKASIERALAQARQDAVARIDLANLLGHLAGAIERRRHDGLRPGRALAAGRDPDMLQPATVCRLLERAEAILEPLAAVDPAAALQPEIVQVRRSRQACTQERPPNG